ncbi:hypothetical protein KI688_008671 [Linnemannia hyalina]|uniref:Uncharacterized protein n=1 Tax=Linnemannia hyalina TaxID=64524 RepID=A0A9P7Y3H6_9FUNG|nr:hypothetical protein KI688_008671 [Linnemannia hyalina]
MRRPHRPRRSSQDKDSRTAQGQGQWQVSEQEQQQQGPGIQQRLTDLSKSPYLGKASTETHMLTTAKMKTIQVPPRHGPLIRHTHPQQVPYTPLTTTATKDIPMEKVASLERRRRKKPVLDFLPSSAESDEYIVHWDRFGEGAIGWTIAFAARTPLFALFSKTLSRSHNPQEDFYLCEWSTLLSAGALEETLRLAIILFLGIGEDFGAVYWLGLGWAGVETVYYIGQSLIYTRWLASPSSDEDYRTVATGIGNGVAATTKMVVAPTVSTSLLASANASAGGPSTSTSTSETPSSLESGYTNGKSRLTNHTAIEEAEDLVPTREARHLLGLDRPWWSLMGRTSSMMVHIGLCCWLGHSGWRLLLPAAAVHGSLYVIWGVFMPDGWSVPATSYGTWIAALGVFLIGLALYGEIV